MREQRAYQGIGRVIKRYRAKYTTFLKKDNLSKITGRFANSFTENVKEFALFQKTYKKIYIGGGKYIDADIKIYSNVEIFENEIVKVENKKYELSFVEKRVECKPVVYIAYGKVVDD